MIEVREELMVETTSKDGEPTKRIAHFIKPVLNPTEETLPQPPFHSLSTDPCIPWLIKKRVFRGMVRPHKGWKTWVESMEKTHESSWKKVGIFDAIKASTYVIEKHDELIFALAERWCPETNTFVFPWGEVTVTLEDVMVLGRFSVLGSCVSSATTFVGYSDLYQKLVDGYDKIKGTCYNVNVSHNRWMEYYMGVGGDIENVALIILWLSRFVFPVSSYLSLSESVFGIAISLARGIRVALAPAVLASAYKDLTLLSEQRDNCSELVLWAPLQLVQLWAWERFPTLGPVPKVLAFNELRSARWNKVKKPKNMCLRLKLKSCGGTFLWRPYTMEMKNWTFPGFYCAEEMLVVVNSELDDDLLSFFMCLRACELVGVDCVQHYRPHRVGRQFGLDQDIPMSLERLYHEKSGDGLECYLPPRFFKGCVTDRYAKWWGKELYICDEQLSSQLLLPWKRGTRFKKLSKFPQRNNGDKALNSAHNIKDKRLETSSFLGSSPVEYPLDLSSKIKPLGCAKRLRRPRRITERSKPVPFSSCQANDSELSESTFKYKLTKNPSQMDGSQAETSRDLAGKMKSPGAVLLPVIAKACKHVPFIGSQTFHSELLESIANEESGKATQEMVVEEANSMSGDFVTFNVTDDEDDNTDAITLGALYSDLEDRVNSLEIKVSFLKPAED